MEIDGSFGEGGGQILRSSLALSIVTGEPVRITKIRANRDKPGLQRQHMTAVKAAAEICDAKLEGAELRSREIAFAPGKVKPGEYRFDIGSAGSTTLVLQTVLPPLMMADAPSRVVITGGTCNMKAPPYEFLARTFLPLLVGPRITMEVVSHGFYPAGGGEIAVTIEPGKPQRIELVELEERRVTAKILLSKLPRRIADAELAVLSERLPLASTEVFEPTVAGGPGNAVFVAVESRSITEIITGFGQRGVPGFKVAKAAADEAERHLAANVPVGEHLADQLLLPMALGEGGRFRTVAPSLHTRTNLEIVKRFLDAAIEVDEIDGKTEISVR